MGGFKFGGFALKGLGLAAALAGLWFLLSNLGFDLGSSPPPEKAAEQMTGASADQLVGSFAGAADGVAPPVAQVSTGTVAAPTPKPQQQSNVLSDAQQRLIAESLQRQAERDQVLEDRRLAAENSPLGDSIYGKVPPRKSAQSTVAAGAATSDGGMGQETSYDPAANLPALAPETGFDQGQGASAGAYGAQADTRYTLAPGTVIGAALMGEIRSELPGVVRAMVTADVFDSTTMRNVVIPRGSQLVGSYANTTTTGQQRLFVYWNSLRLPDGRIFDLGRAGALDAYGASGLTGKRQSGFLASLVQATLLGIAQNATGSQSSSSDLTNAAKIASGQAVGTVAERYLSERLAAGPRFTIAAGTVVNVILEQPFTFAQGAALEDHGALEVSPQRVQPVSWTAPRQVQAQPARPVQAVARAAVSVEAAPSSQAAATIPPYDRSDYSIDASGGWGDNDSDCRNTRQELLAEISTVPVTYSSSGCTVAHGRWLDPYTGKVFTEARGLDIDHLVPLAWAHVHGAGFWPSERKVAFANDKRNLFAVEASVNRDKGAKGPLDWLPPNAAFQCEYTLRFERMVRTWALSLSGDEARGLRAVRDERCA